MLHALLATCIHNNYVVCLQCIYTTHKYVCMGTFDCQSEMLKLYLLFHCLFREHIIIYAIEYYIIILKSCTGTKMWVEQYNILMYSYKKVGFLCVTV